MCFVKYAINKVQKYPNIVDPLISVLTAAAASVNATINAVFCSSFPVLPIINIGLRYNLDN